MQTDSAVIMQSAPRKQNIACDACRTRKVRCVMPAGSDKCQHCQLKNYPCTFNVQRETSEKKRLGGARRRNSETARSNSGQATTTQFTGDTQASSMPTFYPSTFSPQSRPTLAPAVDASVTPGSSFISGSLPTSQSGYLEAPTTQLLAYLFSPRPFPEAAMGYRALSDYQQRHNMRTEDWGEIGVKLQDPAFRREFALDLVEVYFEICHSRIALIGPARFRAQLRASLPPVPPIPIASTSQYQLPSKEDQVHPGILAAVLAWGAKFSEHPLLLLDRNTDPTRSNRSRLAKTLVKKAWEIAEAEKAHFVPSADSVVTCLLLDGLHSHRVNDPDGYRGFWLNCGLRHLLHLQINNRSVNSHLVEPERRNTLTYAWWIACLADAFSSVYFRRKPVLEDGDYNIDFYPQDISRIAQSEAEGPGAEKQLSVVKRPEFMDWYSASHAMARIAREMSRQLWRPIIQTEGIPYGVLCTLIRELHTWRTDYLPKVGVPGTSTKWDFLAAVAACGHDAMYHVMWIILYQTVREVGIREANEIKRSGNGSGLASHQLSEYVTTEQQVKDEALNAASRIAGLADLLTVNSYLRLDPNVMHYSIYSAGKLLAEFGREEVVMCIRGLEQYGISYEDAFEQAEEIQQMYAATTARIGQQQVPQGQVWDSVPANGADSHTVRTTQSYTLTDNSSAYARSTASHSTVPMPRR